MMAKYGGPQWPTAYDLLLANGYDPERILANTADETGYEEIVYGRDGKKFIHEESNSVVVVRKEWHSEQFGLDLMDAIWKDEGLE